MPSAEDYKKVNTSIEISIRLILLFMLIAWCLLLLLPFLGPVLWGVIIAVSVSPLYVSINKKLGYKPKLTSSIIVLLFLAVIIIPSYIMMDSMVDKLQEVSGHLDKGNLEIPPPDASVADWPLIGENVYKTWSNFSENLQKSLSKYNSQIAKAGKSLVKSIMGFTSGLLSFILSILIAGVLLATKGTQDLMQRLFIKLVGEGKGQEFANLTENTIRSVTKGVLGVAFIQAFALGLLFYFAGVPYAGVWGILCLILAIMQLPASLVSIPVVIYIYSVTSPGMATLWAVLIILAGLSDNVLKPILLGKGSKVPMLVIFLGTLGGFMTSGFIGLFTGAIVLSLGYELFMVWIKSDDKELNESVMKS